MLPTSERQRHPEDWVGEELCGKWRIDELIGVGGMAAVYSATQRDGKRVAIKLLHAYYQNDDSIRKRFRREGFAANRVKHPAVVSATGDGIADGGLPFLVLDLLEGVALDQVAADEGKLPAERVLRIADQVLDALIAAHEVGVIHRDLKPDNLIVDDDDTVHVVDFGIAYLEDTGPGPRMTVQGCAMGTPGFMAPEQARGDWNDVCASTDLWSLGATMFSLLTGRDVFVGSPNGVMVATVTSQAPPIRKLLPSLPSPVAAIIDRALAFEPAQRWESARNMQLAVRQVLGLARGAGDVPTLVPIARGEGSRQRSSWQPLFVAALGAAAIALAGSTDYLSARFGSVPVVKPGLATTVKAITLEVHASESGRVVPCGNASDRNGAE
jgi:serine/threonine protein kinase